MPDSDSATNAEFQTYVVFRCNRWGYFERWKANAGVTSSKPVEVESSWGAILEGNVEQLDLVSSRDLCPVDMTEALETRACVAKLPIHLQLAVWKEHVVSGKTRKEKAYAIGIEPESFARRLTTAYGLLLGMFNDVAAGLKPES